MGTVADKLNYLNETKKEIKNVLTNKGIIVNDSDTFRSYPDKIANSLVSKSEIVEKDELLEDIENKADEIIGEELMLNG
jgi:hypothetical protein